MLILGSLYTVLSVSIITGVGYRVEQWGGKWDGTMVVANSCGTVVQGCASYYMSRLLPHRRGCMSKSSVATFFSSIMVRWSELGVTGD